MSAIWYDLVEEVENKDWPNTPSRDYQLHPRYITDVPLITLQCEVLYSIFTRNHHDNSIRRNSAAVQRQSQGQGRLDHR